MKFMYYKVVKLINEKLKLRYRGYSENGDKLKLGQTYSLIYISLFIVPKKENIFIKIDDENVLSFIDSINGIANSKSYASGNRSIPDSNNEIKQLLEGENKDSVKLLNIRYNFFKDLICEFGNVLETLNILENMVKNSVNLNDDKKKEILNYSSLEDKFNQSFKDCDYSEELKIFRILLYSALYSDKKTEYDDLDINIKTNTKYVEREDVTECLSESFKRDNIVYLCGIRGSGKTEIANNFIINSNYFGMITLDYSEHLDDSLMLQEISCLKGKTIDEIKKYIQEMDSKYILVIDNVTAKLTKEWMIFINSCKCHILVLASWQPNYDEIQIVYVNNLSPEQAIQIMDKWIRKTSDLSENQKLIIAKKLNFHALAITVYSKAIEQSCLTYEKIISILKNSTVSDEISEMVTLKQSEELACNHIKALFYDTFKNVIKDDEKSVLRILSLMPTSGISLIDLQKCSGIKNNNPIFSSLELLCWVSVDESKDRNVRIHSVIRDIVMEQLKPDFENCSLLVNYLYGAIKEYWNSPNDGFETTKKYYTVMKNINFCSNNNKFIFDFVTKGMDNLFNCSYINEAGYIYDKTYDFVTLLNGEEKEDCFFVLGRIAPKLNKKPPKINYTNPSDAIVEECFNNFNTGVAILYYFINLAKGNIKIMEMWNTLISNHIYKLDNEFNRELEKGDKILKNRLWSIQHRYEEIMILYSKCI